MGMLDQLVQQAFGGSGGGGGYSAGGASGSGGADSSNSVFSDTSNASEELIEELLKDDEDKEQGIVAYLQELAEKREKEDQESVHGMKDEEYAKLSKLLNEKYGIAYEEIAHGDFSNVAATLAEGIDKGIYDEIAASYDSVLDLVLDEKLNNAMAEIYVERLGGSKSVYGDGKVSWDWSQIVANADILREKYGIDVQVVESKTAYTEIVVSLIDENGNIIKDGNGKLAQVKKSDNMLPDGSCQNVEKFASAAIDQMGYDCVSITDFSPEEYAIIKYMATLSNLDIGLSSDLKTDYLSFKNAMKKSTADWDKLKDEYFKNSGSYSRITSSDRASDIYKNHQNYKELQDKIQKQQDEIKDAIKNETRTKLTRVAFDNKVQDIQKEQGVTEQQAIEIVAKEYYYTDNYGKIKI